MVFPKQEATKATDSSNAVYNYWSNLQNIYNASFLLFSYTIIIIIIIYCQ